MNPGWTALRAALRALRDDGIAMPLWWRDDDATRPTAALDRLEKLGRDLGMTVHIAVIPEPATEELAAHVAGQETLVPLVHGWPPPRVPRNPNSDSPAPPVRWNCYRRAIVWQRSLVIACCRFSFPRGTASTLLFCRFLRNPGIAGFPPTRREGPLWQPPASCRSTPISIRSTGVAPAT